MKNPNHRNAYLLLGQLVSRGLKLQDAVKSATPEQLQELNKQVSNALQFLTMIKFDRE